MCKICAFMNHNKQWATKNSTNISNSSNAKITTLKSNLFPTLYDPYIQNFAVCNI